MKYIKNYTEIKTNMLKVLASNTSVHTPACYFNDFKAAKTMAADLGLSVSFSKDEDRYYFVQQKQTCTACEKELNVRNFGWRIMYHVRLTACSKCRNAQAKIDRELKKHKKFNQLTTSSW